MSEEHELAQRAMDRREGRVSDHLRWMRTPEPGDSFQDQADARRDAVVACQEYAHERDLAADIGAEHWTEPGGEA